MGAAKKEPLATSMVLETVISVVELGFVMLLRLVV